MKIQVLSDLHLEFYRNNELFVPRYLGEDVLVLAGDIQVGLDNPLIQGWFSDLLEERDVVYVFGNHEYYNQDYHKLNSVEREKFEQNVKELADQKGYKHNLYILVGDKIEIDNTVFIGSTLWTDFDNNNEEIMQKAPMVMNDFRIIRNFNPRFCALVHDNERKFIENTLDETPESKNKVVVTHHLPSFESVSPRFRTGNATSLNAFFYTELSHIVEKSDLWICGHTHDSHWYYINDSLVVCNPFGYLGREENPCFSKECLIDLNDMPNKAVVKRDQWRENVQ